MCVAAAVLSVFAIEGSAAVPLVQINATTYKTEHCLFVIDSSVTWSSPATAYADLYAPGAGPVYFPKLKGYFDTLTAQFPGNYFSVCYIANTGDSHVPNYIDRAYKATGISSGAGSAGIGSGATPGTYDAVDICRYNMSGGNVVAAMLGVFDHEIGHAWGAQIFYTLNPPMLANGHWLPNSTVDCQLGGGTSSPPYLTIDKIYGDPTNGFRWQHVDNGRSNDFQVFSEQQLYLMGLHPTFPTSYVLNSPVFNTDLTMGYSSLDTFDHQAAVATYGVRNPDYKTAPKKFKLGFVYVARDLSEVNTVYQNVEQSITSFCSDDTISSTTYRSQTPFLCDTRYRASADGLLADLDGNATPTITVTNTYVTSTDGTAIVAFVASDPDGTTPSVAIVPASSQATISGNNVNITGLPDGVHFFTLKSADAGNKRSYDHFVVEVHRASSSTTISTQPVGQTAIAGNSATFNITATGSPTPLTYRWYRALAQTSTWNALSNGGAYSGVDTAALTVAATPAMDGDQFLCFVSNATGAATSASAALTVNETVPSITSQPSDQAITAAASTYFRVTAGGATTFGYYQYQWQRLAVGSSTWTDVVGSSTYSGPTNYQLTLYGSTLAMDRDQFRCVVSNTAGSVTSSAATLHVGVVPQITTQPVPITSTVGQTVSFTVAASGTAPLSYQWSKFGTVVGHSATLTLTNIQSSDAGTYGVNVTNAFGLAYSNNVGLTVNPAPPAAPTISVQPVTQSTTTGGGVSFSVTAAGSPTPTYQWRKDGVPLSGATAATLSLSNVQSANAGDYTVIVSNASGSVTSAIATLTVTASAIAPSIVTQPQAVAVTAGQAASFTVTASGTAPLSYQWSKGSTALSGATSATLTLANAQASDAGNYSVAVTNSAGSVASATAALTVNPAPTPPAIVTEPQASTTTAGQNASFSVVASGTAPLSYQWSKGSAPIAGATAANLSLSNIQTTDAGSYSVTVSNAAGSTTSATVVLTVSVPPLPPTITTQPQSLSTTVGQSVSFTVAASGATPLTFVWRKNGTAIPGATAAILSVSNVQVPDAADYTVIVTNSVSSVTSAAAKLTVTAAAVAPTISTQPVALTVTAGQAASFAVTASGTAPFTYQWRKNSTNVVGATSATLSITSAQLSDEADYSVVVTNSVTSATSASATLMVMPAPLPPTLVAGPQSVTITAGQSASFTVTVTGTAPFTYQWLKDGASVGGANFATLAIAAAQVSAGGDYTVVVTNSGGSVTSAAAHLTVIPLQVAPIITSQPASLTVPTGAAATFSLTASGATTYAWRFNGTPMAGETNATLSLGNVQPANAGNYSVVVSNAAGSTTSADATLSVSTLDFTGSYFGSFGNDHKAGDFAFLVKSDGSVSLVARFSGSPKVVVSTGIVLHADGTFSIGMPGMALLSQPGGSSRFYDGEIRGQLDGATVTLSAPGLNLTGSTPRSGSGRAQAGRAGVYEALPVGVSSGEVYIAVGEGGEAFLLELGPTSTRSATGAVASDGTLQLTVGSGSATASTYSGSLVGTGFEGSVTTNTGTILLVPTPSTPGKQRLANISSRGIAGSTDKTMIAGFVITGAEPKDVLIRALGPTLTGLGVAGALADPKLTILHGTSTLLENDDWSSSGSEISATTARLGAFPLSAGSKDAVILAHLSPGLYSAQVSIGTGAPGVVIVEVYDAGTTESTAPKLVNISTRAEVGRGDEILIAGFVITGDAPKQVLLRAVGPTLGTYGVNGALADPTIKLFNGATLIKENDNWGDGSDSALIETTASAIGAATLPHGSKDAALLIYLEPGVYSLHVRGVGETTGIALVEVYEVSD